MELSSLLMNLQRNTPVGVLSGNSFEESLKAMTLSLLNNALLTLGCVY
jgi:hypothetical protein